MKLIIIRHGITNDQKERQLSERGVLQAKKTANALKDKKIDFAYSSDLKRTKETTIEIMKYHSGTRLIYEKLLRERDYGTLNGTDAHNIFKDMTIKEYRNYKPSNGESCIELMKRIVFFYQNILKKHENDTVLLISHEEVIRELLFHIFNWEEKLYSDLNVKNASITILEINKEGNYKLEKLDSTEHL